MTWPLARIPAPASEQTTPPLHNCKLVESPLLSSAASQDVTIA